MSAAADEVDPLLGRSLLGGKLRVLRRIGAGGMGAVYEVEHRVTGHHRALKVLHPGAADGEVLARFAREARVSALVRSPHVVETFDAGATEDGMAYVLMELLEGRPLTQLFAERGRLGADAAVELFAQVCEGVAAAHDVGIVHRDLKPDNVFLVREPDGSERVKLLDFGISKFTSHKTGAFDGTLTGEGSMLGTPFYMSPEQVRATRDIDHRVDVYALGVMLYEALSGQRPFEATTFTALVVKIHEGDCTPLASLAPELDPALVALVARAMHKDREARFPSVRELAAALRATQRRPELSAPGERPSWADSGRLLVTLGAGLETGARTLPPGRSLGWSLGLGTALVLLAAVTVIGAGAVWGRLDSTSPRPAEAGRSGPRLDVAREGPSRATGGRPDRAVDLPQVSNRLPRDEPLPLGADAPRAEPATDPDAGTRAEPRPAPPRARRTTTGAAAGGAPVPLARPRADRHPSDGPRVDRTSPY